MKKEYEEILAEANRKHQATVDLGQAISSVREAQEYFDRSLECHWSDELDEESTRAIKILGEVGDNLRSVHDIVRMRITGAPS